MNEFGGLYEPGQYYPISKKISVAQAYRRMKDEAAPALPTILDLAKECQVSWHYASRVAQEVELHGQIQAPRMLMLESQNHRHVGDCLSTDEAYFLLSLRAEAPERPNFDYCHQLEVYSGKRVSPSFISEFFLRGFEHKAKFKKPNIVPVDKFRAANVGRYLEFRYFCQFYSDHTKFNFIDEKHLVNSDCLPRKYRCNPNTGKMDALPVSGDFRESYNLIAVVSPNPEKQHPVEYSIGKQNGTAASFLTFVEYLISRNYFTRGEILVLDNAAIHIGAQAHILTDLLWTYQVDGLPLHVSAVFLPARSPELNPIELVFHILARRVASYRYHELGPIDHAVVKQVSKILNDLSLEVIARCCIHCGY